MGEVFKKSLRSNCEKLSIYLHFPYAGRHILGNETENNSSGKH